MMLAEGFVGWIYPEDGISSLADLRGSRCERHV